MQLWNKTFDLAVSLLPLLGSIIAVCAMLWVVHWLLIVRHREFGNERKFPRQIFILGLALVGLLIVVMTLPVSVVIRTQIISLIGLLASAIIALSSTNIIANFMGGILLRTTKPFHIGDFIRVGSHFGRVSERGLFDTEIQTESRELIAIPNTYLITNPVTTVRSSGTIISTTLSLGYDIHHSQAERLLLKAATETGLQEPVVHIMELGNYAITYRLSGFLAEVKLIITAHSNLCRSILNVLHGQGIEIVSPNYINQRRLSSDNKIIPPIAKKEPREKEPTVIAEEIAFDKAERAEQLEKQKQTLRDNIQRLEADLKTTAEGKKEQVREQIAAERKRLKLLDESANDKPSA